MEKPDIEEADEEEEEGGGEGPQPHDAPIAKRPINAQISKSARIRFVNTYQQSILDVSNALVADTAGNNQLFPSSFTSTLLQEMFLFPNQQLYALIRSALRASNLPIVAFRWNMPTSTLTPELSRTCAATLFKHVKRILKTQNAAFFDSTTDNENEFQKTANVYLSTSLFPEFDAQDVFVKPLKLNSEHPASMHPPPQHLVSAYWYLRKRIPAFLDVSFVFEKSELETVHPLFWQLVDEVVFEEADVVVFGVGECNGEGASGLWEEERRFVDKMRTRRKARAVEIFPPVGEDDTDAPRDGDGRKVVYHSLTWK
ncbi:hypothetical protein HDU98_007582 [Podochytrium sp. JEL0797]|nr:hypothetical protein HDU98_007582 [Podochytrium sp. JEL0797]